MSELAYEERQTKTTFERKLVADFGLDNLTSSPYEEMAGGTRTKMNLYYNSGVHVGTWCKGQGWIFKSAYKTS